MVLPSIRPVPGRWIAVDVAVDEAHDAPSMADVRFVRDQQHRDAEVG
jgi:hypothetical protein